MKIYYPKNLYTENNRNHLFPLLKPFIKKDGFTDLERIKTYGVSDKSFTMVADLILADVVVLPMSWNYYQKQNMLKQVVAFIQEVEKHNLRVWSFTNGDLGVKTPKCNNLVVFRSNGRKSKVPINHEGIPVFINDPLKEYFNSEKIKEIEYTKIPIIGFCGQADASLLHAVKSILITVIKNSLGFIKMDKQDVKPLIATTYLRAKILMKLKQTNKVQDNFIWRKQYRAGVKKLKEKHTTTLAFYNNMKNAQYVVCVRGAGNFSVRFYETLAMGRIPVLINTDCILPLTNTINWKEHVVWVAYKDRNNVASIVLDFHQKKNPEELFKLFEKNRKLWEEKLTLSSFFKEVQ